MAVKHLARSGLSAVVGLVLTVLLAGCGSDSEGVFSAIGDGGDFREPGKSLGPLAGFALEGVVVNGVTYETLGTRFLINEVDGSQGDLDKAMLVRVDVSDGAANRAERIVYEDDLRGPLLADDFNPLTRTLNVLGQRVRFNDATVFHGRWSLDELPELFTLGNNRALVVVSGWHLDSGELLASYIRARQFFIAGLGDLKLQGIIRAVDPAASTLVVGNLTIRYDQNTRIDMAFDQDRILSSDVGDFVQVKGFVNELAGPLVAQSIQQEDRAGRLAEPDDIDNAPVTLEGVITRGRDSGAGNTLAVSGIALEIDSETDLDGLDRATLREGRRVLVDGIGRAESTVLAERIRDRQPEASVEASIEAVDASLENPNRAGRMIVGGVRVEVTRLTLVVDSGTELGNFDIQFGDLMPGQLVEVAGVPREDAEGSFIDAVKVERNDRFAAAGLIAEDIGLETTGPGSDLIVGD